MRATFKNNITKKFCILGMVSIVTLCASQPFGQTAQACTG